MSSERPTRRSRGTGSLFTYRGAWYGQWYVGRRLIKRKLGPKRRPGGRDGLTRPQAERELRRRIEAESNVKTVGDRRTVEEAGERLIEHLGALGRKPTTLGTYSSLLRTHLARHLATRSLDRMDPDDVERMIVAMRREGAGPKTIVNALTLLHQVFEFGARKGWCQANPCKQVDRPQLDDTAEIRFLGMEEVEALLRATPEDHPLGPTDRPLYLTATMTGLRQGELLALRWRDVDWAAGRIRVRQNYVRGHWGTPKSRRGSRSVPMADRVAGELERHYQGSAFQADDDLVFPHPETGAVLNHSQLVRRFKRALRAAGVREVRFNDLRHTFGTRMAASGVPLRTLQEWMGHRDFKTTLIYADYAPSEHESEMVERAFAAGIKAGIKLSETEQNSGHLSPLDQAEASSADPDIQG